MASLEFGQLGRRGPLLYRSARMCCGCGSARVGVRPIGAFSCLAGVGKSSGHDDGSSTIFEKITARAAASGRRAHHRCRVEGWPCRIDFSRAAALLMASRGRATSMSFLRVLGAVTSSTAGAGLWRDKDCETAGSAQVERTEPTEWVQCMCSY